MKDNLKHLSAAQIGRAVNSKQLSPVEVVEYFIERIHNYNQSLNAFVYIKADQAYDIARKQEKAILAGETLGEFAGVPFALKDFLSSKKGWTHSFGGLRCLTQEDKYNSKFCSAMEQAGGIALGKTNSPTYGFRGTCDNKLYGPTHNPFNLEYNSGGSSGGSASAVAGGLIPIAEGGDAGGSIRIPAAWCNCFGYKPSVGTIPSVCRPDAWAATHPYCFNGGITKTVEDAVILLSYMAKFNRRDPLSVPNNYDFMKCMEKTVKGMRIAYTADFGIFQVDPEVSQIVEKAAKRFEEAGAIVEPVSFNFMSTLAELAEAWCYGICIDTAIEFEQYRLAGNDYFEKYAQEFPQDFIEWNRKVAKSNILDLYNFNIKRTEILDNIDDMLSKYDLIISPTSACLPVLNADDGDTKGPETINGKKVEPLIGFAETFLANMSGNPAASIPAGFSASGLPVGMQIIGNRFDDDLVLRACAVFEKLQPWQDAYKNIKVDN